MLSCSLPKSILSSILPATAFAAELIGEMPSPEILAEEAAVLGPAAVDKRRREFATGRWLAHRALEQLGAASIPILSGANRQPIWPEGVVGSITHCRGYCAAAVAFASDLAALGIDAEEHEPLPRDILGVVARPEEQQWIAARAAGAIHWDRLLFSAKESVFKAWFPIMRCWLGFEDATIVFDQEAQTFRADLLAGPAVIDDLTITTLHGRYLAHGDHIVTSVVIPARHRSSSAAIVPT